MVRQSMIATSRILAARGWADGSDALPRDRRRFVRSLVHVANRVGQIATHRNRARMTRDAAPPSSRRPPASQRRSRTQAPARRRRTPGGFRSTAQDPDVPPVERGRAGPDRSDHRLGSSRDIGIEFRGDADALALWRKAGADVQGERVRFEPGFLKAIIAESTPRSFTQHARNPDRSVLIGQDNVVFAPAYGAPLRARHGQRQAVRHARGLREPREADVRLALAAPLRRHGVRTGRPARQQAPPRHGLRAPALERQAVHGVRHHAGAGRGLHRDGPHRVRRSVRRRALRDHGQHQHELAARLRRGDVRLAAGVRAREPVSGNCPIHPGRRDGSGVDGGRGRAIDGRGHGGGGARAARAAGLARGVRQLPDHGEPEDRLADLRHAGVSARLVRGPPSWRSGSDFRCGAAAPSPRRSFRTPRPCRRASRRSTPRCCAAPTSSCMRPAGWRRRSPSATRSSCSTRTIWAPSIPCWVGLALDSEALALDALPGGGTRQSTSSAAPTPLSRYETAFHECEIADTDSYENWIDAGGKDSMVRANAQVEEDPACLRAAAARRFDRRGAQGIHGEEEGFDAGHLALRKRMWRFAAGRPTSVGRFLAAPEHGVAR